jgi:hypothetical protein
MTTTWIIILSVFCLCMIFIIYELKNAPLINDGSYKIKRKKAKKTKSQSDELV